jgi:hypothetical protein
MANSVIGALRVMLGMDTAEFEAGSTKAQREAKRLERKFATIGGNLQKVGVGLTAAITAPLTAFAIKGVQEAQQSAAAIAQVEAALASMGPVAQRSSDQLKRAAESFEGSSLFEADVILKQVTANLLTFGNIAGEQFDRAQQAAIDMATRLGGEPQAAAIALGKALNDPIKGITALTRVGVQFNEQQKAQIKTMVEAGDAAGAQRVILAELERQFGGAAQAAQDADPINRFNDALNSLAETVGNVLLPVLTPIVEGIAGFAKSIGELPKGAQTALVVFGGLAAAAGPLLIALGGIVSITPAIVAGFGAVSAAALPIAAVIAGVAAAGYLIYENWDRIAPVLEETAAAFDKAIGEDLRQMVAEASAKLTELWNGPLGEAVRVAGQAMLDFQLAYGKVLGSAFIQILDAAATAVGGTFNAILNTLTAVSRFLSGDFSGAWRAVGDLVTGIGRTVAGVIDALFPGLIQMGKDIIRGIVAGIRAAPGAVRDALLGVIQSGVDTVKDFLGIRSPSVLFMQIGDDVMRGLAIGLEKGKGPISDVMKGLAEQTEVETVRITETFEQLVNNVMGSLRGLVDGIKKGDFFSIFEGILGIVTKLGGAGVFGKSFQAKMQSIPAFATGGAMKLGGLSGIDRNVLSLNGSPIARVSAGETMQINPANDARMGALKISVTMDESTGALGAFVRNEAGQVVASAAPSIAAAGAGQAVGRIRQMQSRALS